MPRQRWVLVALVCVHVVAAGHVFLVTKWGRQTFVGGDNKRYHEIAHAPGLPYRDHEVEYPPLTAAFIEIVAAPSHLSRGGKTLVITQLLADLTVAAALAWGWSRRAAVVWLALLVPFLWDGWVFARIDLLASALTVTGLAAVRRRAERRGGVLIGLGVLAKLYPALLVPGLLVNRRRQAAGATIITTAVGALVWLAIGGLAGLRQVLTFRGAKGWQVESTVGALVLAFTRGRVYVEAGAARVGVEPGWAKAVLLLALVSVVVWVWKWQRRAEPERAETYGAIAMIGALMLLSPLFSPQYLVWILPFMAVASSDRILLSLSTFVMCATAWVAHRYRFIGHHSGELLWIVNLRNAAMVAVVALSAARLSGLGAAYTARRTRRSRSHSDRSSTPGTWDHAAP
ncbi:MAG: hypothetical protein QOD72_2642 [Acidimicrobiaceae bacterium]|nr:hypothetical protein [Acidimicrobiaceae bacterium]